MSRLMPYGNTASTPMSRPYGGSTFSMPSMGLQPSLESFANSTLNTNPLMAGRKDPVSGRFIHDVTPRENYISLYDLQADKRNVGLQGSYPQEVFDFPDVFNMPNVAQTLQARMDAMHMWPIESTMPMRLTDRLDYQWIELIFNDTTPDRGAEEAVPTLVTSEFYKQGASLVRWMKGAKMERNAYLTPRGRMQFYMQIEQIHLGVVHRIIHDILSTLIWSEDGPERSRQQRRSVTSPNAPPNQTTSVNKLYKEDIDNRFILNKDPNQISVLVDQIKADYAANSNGMSQPNRLIMFNGAKQFYKRLGASSQNMFWYDHSGNTHNTYVIESRSVRSDLSFGFMCVGKRAGEMDPPSTRWRRRSMVSPIVNPSTCQFAHS